MAYLFDTQVLHDIIRSALPLPTEAKAQHIRDELERRYPGHIAPRIEWIFNIAGGAMGHMAVLHASLTEYILVFGSPIGTEGYSGRFLADDFFYILEGEQWAYGESELERRVYKAGDMHHLPRGVARGYRFPDRCYAVEYARGAIPLMLPFGLGDSFSSTLDPIPVAKTIRAFTQGVMREMSIGAKEGIKRLKASGPRAFLKSSSER